MTLPEALQVGRLIPIPETCQEEEVSVLHLHTHDL